MFRIRPFGYFRTTKKARVFERFKQTCVCQDNNAKGSGLGLSICRELTEIDAAERWKLHSTTRQRNVFLLHLGFAEWSTDATVSSEGRRSTTTAAYVSAKRAQPSFS